MTKKKEEKEKTDSQNPGAAAEPAESYFSGISVPGEFRITISTVENQDADLRSYWGSITPEKRLENLHNMICRIYGIKPGAVGTKLRANEIVIVPPDEHFS